MKHQKIAVIGCGVWGRNIVRNFYNLNVLDIVCDLDESNLEKVKEQYPGVKTTKDFNEIINNNSRKITPLKRYPKVTLVVPAHNEELVISKTTQAILS